MHVDMHTVIDLVTLVVAVGGTFLASRRDLLARLSAIETSIAEIKGALNQAGFNISK